MCRTSWIRPEVLLIPILAAVSIAAAAETSPFTQRDVTFRNGAVELSGTLILPAGNGPHPALIFLHGSGPATRDGARPYAEEFAKLGLAGLIFDKRGSGRSGGSWITSSLDDLAGDALAAVAFLKAQDGIDPRRIGLWGVSQAGWVGTVAAARAPDVAFMVLISGGGASPKESELYSYRRAFDEMGLSAADQSKAFDILGLYFGYLATGAGRTQLETRLETIQKGPLSPLAERLGQILPSEENRSNWAWVATYDPAADIARIKCPLLLMFGDKDRDHPTEVAVRKWREGLEQAGNDQSTIMVFPGAGHGVRMGEHHAGSGRPPFADGYREAMIGWLWLHVVHAD